MRLRGRPTPGAIVGPLEIDAADEDGACEKYAKLKKYQSLQDATDKVGLSLERHRIDYTVRKID
jgi:hypothetical protein